MSIAKKCARASWCCGVVALAAVAFAEHRPIEVTSSSIMNVRFDFDAETTNRITFLWETRQGPHATALRNAPEAETHPFLIVFEGNDNLPFFSYRTPGFVGPEPEIDTGRVYRSHVRNGNVIEAFAQPLVDADPRLTASLVQNLLLIQDQSLVRTGAWLLNRTMTECEDTSLTYQQGAQLIQDKYNWNLTPVRDVKDPAQLQDVLVEHLGRRAKMREVVLGYLRRMVARLNKESGEPIVRFYQLQAYPGSFTILSHQP